jgi:Family of unknown function (DUF6544)
VVRGESGFLALGGISFRVTDSYQPPNGLLEVRLLGIPVQRNRGSELAFGERFRCLAELPWVPQAILANPQLECASSTSAPLRSAPPSGMSSERVTDAQQELMDDVYSEADECQQHYGRFAGDERVARTRGHLQPRPGAQLDLLAVNGEAETSGQDLNHSSMAGLMLGEPLAGIEAEHGDVHPVAPVYDLGDNGTGLYRDFAGEIGDQRMRHNAIIVRPTLTVNVPDTLTDNRAVARDEVASDLLARVARLSARADLVGGHHVRLGCERDSARAGAREVEARSSSATTGSSTDQQIAGAPPIARFRHAGLPAERLWRGLRQIAYPS